jgi:hypothetical protein
MMSKTTYPTSVVVTVNASIGDVTRTFADLAEAQDWLDDVQMRLQWMENSGLLALVNGSDHRWGRNGHEHMGWQREPGRRHPKSLKLMLQRTGNYLGKWMSMRDAPTYRDRSDHFPLDLTGKVRDLRPLQRAPWPYRAEETPGNVTVPPAWTVGPDGYYYHQEPDVLLHAGFEHWEPANAGGQLSFTFAANTELLQAA